MAISEQVTSTVLVVERAKEQIPVYYISNALTRADANYPPIEKFVYALVMANKKLWPYFEVYKVTVLTYQPLKNVLQKLDASGRLLKWPVELTQYNLVFKA